MSFNIPLYFPSPFPYFIGAEWQPHLVRGEGTCRTPAQARARPQLRSGSSAIIPLGRKVSGRTRSFIFLPDIVLNLDKYAAFG